MGACIVKHLIAGLETLGLEEVFQWFLLLTIALVSISAIDWEANTYRLMLLN